MVNYEILCVITYGGNSKYCHCLREHTFAHVVIPLQSTNLVTGIGIKSMQMSIEIISVKNTI